MPLISEWEYKVKYSVALSFAGEDRIFAEKLATGLRANGVAVFYDKFEQHDLWGKDLYEELQKVYVRECRYCILIIGNSYLNKMWTIYERKQIIDRLAHEHGSDCVLPIKLNGFDGEIPGLNRGHGFVALNDNQAQDVVELVLRKLGKPEYEIDSTSAFERAAEAVKQRRLGFIDVAHFYTSPDALTKAYESFNGVATVHGWLGHTFIWKTDQTGCLELFAKNDSLDSLKDRGIVFICKFKAPSSWQGCGLWKVLPPNDFSSEEFDDKSELVITLYLYSEDPAEMERLAEEPDDSAFLAGVCFKGYEVERFYRLAKENYDDLL